MTPMSTLTLALDLEGTLISNAVSQFARRGLYGFLEGCRRLFPRMVIFTSVSEERFRAIVERLVRDGFAPEWFATIEYVHWHGPTKDLTFVPGCDPSDVFLVDDCAGYVHPGQEAQWVPVKSFHDPVLDAPAGVLSHLLNDLEQRMLGRRTGTIGDARGESMPPPESAE